MKRGSYKKKSMRKTCHECGGSNLGTCDTGLQKGKHYTKAYCKDCRYANSIKKNYDLTLGEYDRMLDAQGGGCAVCGTADPGSKRVARFAVDHDHQTGKIRGLLCYACNFALGLCKDDISRLQALIRYLRNA